ncbi:MAG: hypothetical protein AAF127_15140 [Pseudomonadota bacterium]
MTDLVQEKLARGEARIVAAPKAAPKVRHQVEVDRNFELPNGLYVATVAGYLGFLGLMLASFGNPALAIPMVIFAGFIIAGFGVPAIWTRLASNRSKPMGFGAFQNKGIMTNTGLCAPLDAAIQVLILPALIVVWGAAIAIIAAVVA